VNVLRLLVPLALLGAGGTQAHEFWVLPHAFQLQAPAATLSLTLSVGENFAGEPVAFSRALVAQLRRHDARGGTDLRATVPAEARPALRVPLARAGSHVLAIATEPSHIELSADKFHAYLHEEGLDHVIRQREAAGQSASPGRERYRRNIKTLVRVGQAADAVHATAVGHTFELVLLQDPAAHRIGDDLRMRALFNGQPLAGALIKLWHRRSEQTLVIRSRSDARGEVAFTPPWPGTWMASAVHMVSAPAAGDHEWDSYWANYTFSLPSAAAR
jgi:hypothetical protein